MSDVTEGIASEKEQTPAGFLSLMRNRNYSLLWWGQLVSELGNRFHWIAISLWIYSITHSAIGVSLAISSIFVGGLLVGLWAGVVVDRVNRKSILIISDLSRVVLVALIPSLLRYSIWPVYVDLVIISMATTFFRPALLAVIPQVVSQNDLLPANSFFSAMDTGTEIVGPAIAGLLVFSLGYASLMYLDAATYAVSAACVLAMSIPPLISPTARNLNLGAIWSGMVEGLQYIRKDQLQRGLFVLIFPAALVGSGLNALQTPLAKGVVGITDKEFGTFNSIWGVGFVVASLLLGWYGSKARKSSIIVAGYFCLFASAALMGVSSTFQALLLTGFAVGFSNTLSYVGLATVLMKHTPQFIMGRVFSTRQVAISLIRVISPVVFGALADIVGVRQAILVMTLIGGTGTAAVFFAQPVLVRFDARPKAERERQFALWRIVAAPIDPSLDARGQRSLNAIGIGIALIGWLGVLYRSLTGALWVLFAVVVLASAGSLMRHRKLR